MSAMKLLLVTALLTASQAQAAWTLDNDDSLLSFISIKASDIAEVHHFTSLSGAVEDDGGAIVEIQLADVETMIPIRNERMQELLFEVKVFPVATITTTVDLNAITALEPGTFTLITAEVLLDLHGEAAPLIVDLRVTRLSEGRFSVASEQPVIVNAGMFNLVDGIEALREVAGLPNISKAVPVTFTLVFDRS
jgi:polyisoprenoid-binding protein YceI